MCRQTGGLGRGGAGAGDDHPPLPAARRPARRYEKKHKSGYVCFFLLVLRLRMYVYVRVCINHESRTAPPQTQQHHNPTRSGHGAAAADALPAVRRRGQCVAPPFFLVKMLRCWLYFFGGGGRVTAYGSLGMDRLIDRPTPHQPPPSIQSITPQAMNDNEDMALAACQCLETLNTLVQVCIYVKVDRIVCWHVIFGCLYRSMDPSTRAFPVLFGRIDRQPANPTTSTKHQLHSSGGEGGEAHPGGHGGGDRPLRPARARRGRCVSVCDVNICVGGSVSRGRALTSITTHQRTNQPTNPPTHLPTQPSTRGGVRLLGGGAGPDGGHHLLRRPPHLPAGAFMYIICYTCV